MSEQKNNNTFINWYVACTTGFALLYVVLVTFAQIPKDNIHFVDISIGFLLGTVVSAGIGYFLGGSNNPTKPKTSEGTTTANIEASITTTPDTEKEGKAGIISTIILLITCLSFIFASSCVTEKKSIAYLDKHPAKAKTYAVKVFDNIDSAKFGINDSLAATYASKRYPCKDSTHTQIKYLPGKPILVPGETVTVAVDCDSLKKAGQSGKIIVNVPVYKQVDTSSIISTVFQTDKAKYNSLLAQYTSERISLKAINEKQSKQLISATDNAKKYKKYFIWSLVVILALVIISLVLRKLGL